MSTFIFLVFLADHPLSLNFSRHLPLVFFIRAYRRAICIDLCVHDVTLSFHITVDCQLLKNVSISWHHYSLLQYMISFPWPMLILVLKSITFVNVSVLTWRSLQKPSKSTLRWKEPCTLHSYSAGIWCAHAQFNRLEMKLFSYVITVIKLMLYLPRTINV